MSLGLTGALASLGGVVLVGVIAHGAWSARRARPKLGTADVPVEPGGRIEPVIEGGDVDAVHHPEGDARPTRMPPGLASADLPERAAERRPNRRLALRLDALIDSIATLRLEAPVAGSQIVSQLPPTRRAGAKAFLVEGLDTETGEWEVPVAEHRYGELQAGVQLANRSGPLNEIEFSEFVQKVQAFADAVGALADFPDMLEAVAAGRELDRFADAHDAQLAVHLQAREVAWSVGYVLQQAARHGFVAGVVPGRLVLPNTDQEGAPPMLTLSFDPQAALADDPNLAALRDLTLAFDVPQSAAELQPFDTWRSAGLALAAELEAHLVDDLGRMLPPESLAAIGSELVRLYAALDGRELPAGSPAARRLFS